VLHCLICSPVLIHSVPKPAAVFLLLPEPISQPVLFLCFDLPQQGVSPTDQAWVFASVVWIPASRWFIFILELKCVGSVDILVSGNRQQRVLVCLLLLVQPVLFLSRWIKGFEFF
jgi:hypothetical protein